jgi:hypothetical protein
LLGNAVVDHVLRTATPLGISAVASLDAMEERACLGIKTPVAPAAGTAQHDDGNNVLSMVRISAEADPL